MGPNQSPYVIEFVDAEGVHLSNGWAREVYPSDAPENWLRYRRGVLHQMAVDSLKAWEFSLEVA